MESETARELVIEQDAQIVGVGVALIVPLWFERRGLCMSDGMIIQCLLAARCHDHP